MVEYELYDYENDPLETTNISKKKKNILRKLIRKLEQYPHFKRPVKM